MRAPHRDDAVKFAVGGLINLAHAARSNMETDLVAAETGSWNESHMNDVERTRSVKTN